MRKSDITVPGEGRPRINWKRIFLLLCYELYARAFTFDGLRMDTRSVVKQLSADFAGLRSR
jgi:hypothetical protein